MKSLRFNSLKYLAKIAAEITESDFDADEKTQVDTGEVPEMSEEERRRGLEKARQDRPWIGTPEHEERLKEHRKTYSTAISGKGEVKHMFDLAQENKLNNQIQSKSIINELTGILSKLIGEYIRITLGDPNFPSNKIARIINVNPYSQVIEFEEDSKGGNIRHAISYHDFFYHKKWDGKEYMSDGDRAKKDTGIGIKEDVPPITLEQASKDRLKKLRELITPATSIDWKSESKDISNEPPPSWSSWLTGKK